MPHPSGGRYQDIHKGHGLCSTVWTLLTNSTDCSKGKTNNTWLKHTEDGPFSDPRSPAGVAEGALDPGLFQEKGTLNTRADAPSITAQVQGVVTLTPRPSELLTTLSGPCL